MQNFLWALTSLSIINTFVCEQNRNKIYAKYQADCLVIILHHTILIDIDIYLDNPYNCIL